MTDYLVRAWEFDDRDRMLEVGAAAIETIMATRANISVFSMLVDARIPTVYMLGEPDAVNRHAKLIVGGREVEPRADVSQQLVLKRVKAAYDVGPEGGQIRRRGPQILSW